MVNVFELNSSVAAALDQTLRRAQGAFAGGAVQSGDKLISSFNKQVQEQTGKTLTTTQSATLIRLARSLMK